MLQLKVSSDELWDESISEFIPAKTVVIQLEHSLVSLQKWESKWHKAFFSKGSLTEEETLDYVKCMTLTENVSDETYELISKSPSNMQEIMSYIDNPMSATVIADTGKKTLNGEKITAELIYYWMISLNMPAEYSHWHLNQLITLIRVCNIKNTPPKKLSPKEIAQRNRELNEKRKKELNTKG